MFYVSPLALIFKPRERAVFRTLMHIGMRFARVKEGRDQSMSTSGRGCVRSRVAACTPAMFAKIRRVPQKTNGRSDHRSIDRLIGIFHADLAEADCFGEGGKDYRI